MRAGTIALLILSSLGNAALAAAAFLFRLFATSPDMSDATMRLGFHALNVITVLAAAGVGAPWALALRGHGRASAVVALLPAALSILAVAVFLLLDSWIRRTF